MERLQELINQLQEQVARNAEPSQMLVTTRQVEAELNRLAELAARSRVSTKVSVMMPSSMKIYSGQAAAQEAKAAVVKEQVKEPQVQPEQKPVAVEVKTGVAEKVAVAEANGTGPWPYDPLAEVPTLAQHQPKEINDVIGRNGTSSLNDKLRSDVLELKSALNDTPVRDLKKAIGVNDRFVFINQLFRGDEVMYERSLKTINGFRILPEAEYWMERELKVKLGWDETREATKHFYQVVKRRFS
jgi:hypothetical protein